MRFLLHQQMPFSRGLAREVLYACGSGIIALIIFHFARPLGFEHLNDLTLWGFGLASIAAAVLYLLITHYCYYRFWGGRNWTLALEIVHSLAFLVFVAAGIMLYGSWAGAIRLNFRSALSAVFYTLLLGLAPVVVRALLVRNWRLKKDLAETKRLNELLQNGKAVGDEQLIQIPLPGKEPFLLPGQSLLFIESRGNYINICWRAGTAIKKQLIRITMKEAVNLINDPLVTYCHRSFVVNLRNVRGIMVQDGASYMLMNETAERVPVSGTFKKEIVRKLDRVRNVMGRIDIITGTLGKALGGALGGFTSGRREIIEMLRQRSRPYLFSNSLAPSIVGASIAVLELLSETTALRDKLEYNTRYFRKHMTEAGFDIKPGDHPIVPIMLYDAVVAQNFAAKLLDEGIYVIGFFYPVVAKGLARIRVQLSAAHEQHHLDKAIAAFTKIGKELGVVKSAAVAG